MRGGTTRADLESRLRAGVKYWPDGDILIGTQRSRRTNRDAQVNMLISIIELILFI